MSADIAVIGAGPAGLMAAEALTAAGHRVTVYERMPSPARKLLMAGRGGLNLTHSEPLPAFLARFGPGDVARARLAAAIQAFPPEALVAWAQGLGQDTFTGSSGRVFPKAMKASPLLRAWLRRLASRGIVLATRHDWIGWSEDGSLRFTGPDGQPVLAKPAATVLALGGASWPRLGGRGAWLSTLQERGVLCHPLTPSNCGIVIAWSTLLRDRFEGEPLKRIALTCADKRVRGEALLTRAGLEGGAVYALNDAVRGELAANGTAALHLDLRPDLTLTDLARKLAEPRQKQSTSTFLRKAAHLSPVDIALLREVCGASLPAAPYALAGLIKEVPLTVAALAGLDRAISSAGGIALDALDDRYMLRAMPGVFAAGEMLDWDAPTGGYLLQATIATAVAAATGVSAWLVGSSDTVARQ